MCRAAHVAAALERPRRRGDLRVDLFVHDWAAVCVGSKARTPGGCVPPRHHVLAVSLAAVGHDRAPNEQEEEGRGRGAPTAGKALVLAASSARPARAARVTMTASSSTAAARSKFNNFPIRCR